MVFSKKVIVIIFIFLTQVYGSMHICRVNYYESVQAYKKALKGGRTCGATNYMYEEAYERMNEAIHSCWRIHSKEANSILHKIKKLDHKLRVKEKVVGGSKYCNWL